MKKICYHGTNADAVQSILKEGFRLGSWFAAHLEDAIAYGGLHIFEVVFEDVQDAWQFHVLSEISPEHIVNYSVFQQRRVFENSILREEIFQKTTGDKTMKSIQSMPDIWDDQPFLTSKSEILGALANWAVQQSPYNYPEDLGRALFEFGSEFACSGGYFATSCEELPKRIRQTFERCPTIRGWNVAKKGSGNVFVSRYDNPHPDYDFIDLYALARNIAHSITLQNKYDQLHD